MIEIYTDGSCKTDTGHGSWAFAVCWKNGVIFNASCSVENTTSNRMEMIAIIEALKYTRDCTSPLVIYSDSKLCVQTLNKWAHKWKKFGWARNQSQTKAVKNLDLVTEAYELYHSLEHVSLKWIKGHAGHVGNEIADRLAYQARKRMLPYEEKGIRPKPKTIKRDYYTATAPSIHLEPQLSFQLP